MNRDFAGWRSGTRPDLLVCKKGDDQVKVTRQLTPDAVDRIDIQAVVVFLTLPCRNKLGIPQDFQWLKSAGG